VCPAFTATFFFHSFRYWPDIRPSTSERRQTERRSRYCQDITGQESTLCSVVFCSIVLLATYCIYITGSHPCCLHHQASLIHKRFRQLLLIPSSFENCFCYRTLPIRTGSLTRHIWLTSIPSLVTSPQATDHRPPQTTKHRPVPLATLTLRLRATIRRGYLQQQLSPSLKVPKSPRLTSIGLDFFNLTPSRSLLMPPTAPRLLLRDNH
jgi:hypothetical protein